MPTFMRGARPSPRHKLLAAVPHLVITAPPPQFAYVPPRLSVWGNDQHGDCVTAEEAFAKACHAPELFVSDADVIAWATKHGVLEGADLVSVMEAMRTDGWSVEGTTWDDGPHVGVDFSNETTLQSAISSGPVKIAIDADALPPTAGEHQGWCTTATGHWPNTDHCVSLAGYGPAQWLYQQLGVALPSVLQPSQPGYLLFTWGTLGFVTHGWLMGTCVEAWLRNPTTIAAGPTPTPTPTPPAPPAPTIRQYVDAVFAALKAKFAGNVALVMVLTLVQTYLDAWLVAHGYGATAIGPSLKAIIDAALTEAMAQYPGWAPLISVVKSLFDQYA